MKKIIIVSAVIVLAAGCKPGPVVLDGKIDGYDGQVLTANISKDFTYDTLAVNPDGTFHFEKKIEEPLPGLLSIVKSGRKQALFVPGKHYTFDVDLTATPAKWEYSCDCPAEDEFYRYLNDTLIHFDYAQNAIPDKFSDFCKIWDERLAEGEKRLQEVKDKRALDYFRNTIEKSVRSSKINYAFQVAKKGIDAKDDEDYLAYFNSIKLDDDKAGAGILSTMLSIKKEMYDDSMPESLKYLKAVEELAPTRHLKDSLSLKHVEAVFLDGDIYSEEEASALLEVAERLVSDEDQLNEYRELVEKTLSLVRGKGAIDFEFEDVDGKLRKLSDFKGKAVYVDFWATWCVPCCLQIPHMKVLSAKYANDSRIEFISVSFDEKRDDWKGMLEFDTPSWPQYRTLDSGKSIMKDYGFRAIPRFMLFDKDGRIVSANAPRPEALDEISTMIDEIL